MDYEYQHQPYQATVSSFASAPNSASESAYSKRKSAYLPSTSPPPVPYYQQSHQLDPYQQQQHQSMYLPQHQYHGQHNHQDPYQEQHNQFQSLQQEQLHQYEYQQQQSHRDSQYQEDINMDLDTATGTPLNLASSSKLKPSSLRTLGKREFNSISPPPIMTTPLYGSQKFASSTQSPPPYYAGLPGQDTTAEMNTFNFNHTDVNQRQYQFLSYQPSDSQGHERQQQKQRYFQHYNTAPNTRHNSFSHHQTASQYYQDLPVDSVLPQTGTGVFVTAGEGGGGEIYPRGKMDGAE
ncbi:hypothetical protein BC939DRAFT_477791 [Gamsiella multidivaricata]|uniref:uncharacterized protein n=1 Tax=Gamsiella multidivaricata TaxID=101098 RepID=UPI00221EE45F|nr:uncharacterized protein BC939DRAFT_477791 [Gamsiella multidivaricata]KAI7822325.1 hypothetical protein BC939DRAFT_477791 [Gamsiella multidivaricata]